MIDLNCTASKGNRNKSHPLKSLSVGHFYGKKLIKEAATSKFTYLHFGSTTFGRARQQRKPVFDYVPWSFLDR